MVQLLDQRITQGYRLWPNNYIAADLLSGNESTTHYTPDQRATFEAYLDKACAENPIEGFREILLGIYAGTLRIDK